MQTPNSNGVPTHLSSPYNFKSFLLLWPLFFAICIGLGYATLHRYDPRKIPGLSDTYKYYALTVDADLGIYFFKELFLGRVLVPFVARPFYWFASRFLPSVNAGFSMSKYPFTCWLSFMRALRSPRDRLASAW